MNKEFDLDNLKAAWQEKSVGKSYSSSDIFEMLKRKSITSVKWVFIISLIEIIIGIVLYIYYVLNFGANRYHDSLLAKTGSWAYVYESLVVLLYVGTIYFIIRFFMDYKKISVQSSVKSLSSDIINFRKVVNYFIYFNLIILLFTSIILVISSFMYNPEFNSIEWFSVTGLGIIVGVLFSIAIMVGVLWLYYYLIYGTFQRRLKNNLKELNRMEE